MTLSKATKTQYPLVIQKIEQAQAVQEKASASLGEHRLTETSLQSKFDALKKASTHPRDCHAGRYGQVYFDNKKAYKRTLSKFEQNNSLLAEFSQCTEISHPFLAFPQKSELHDTHYFGTFNYTEMLKIEGEPLSHLDLSAFTNNMPAFCKMLVSFLIGLEYTLALGFVNTDTQSSNLIQTDENHLVLIDWDSIASTCTPTFLFKTSDILTYLIDNIRGCDAFKKNEKEHGLDLSTYDQLIHYVDTLEPLISLDPEKHTPAYLAKIEAALKDIPHEMTDYLELIRKMFEFPILTPYIKALLHRLPDEQSERLKALLPQ